MLSLTGPVIGWGTVLLTVGALVAVVVLLPRWAEPRRAHVASRAGVVLAVNLLVLLTAAVQLNDQFLFFADWADLDGALTGTTASTGLHRGGTSAQAARTPVSGPAAVRPGTLEPLPPGSDLGPGVTRYRVPGPLSGITADVVVAAPDGYRDDPTTSYPVLETFSGYPGAPQQWIQAFHLPEAVDREVAAHRLARMLIISPQLEVPAGTDTECVDGLPGDPQVETWLTRDVPDWVAAHFRVRVDRGSWATVGMSAGGWCAAMAAMLHPAQYGGAIVMAGYFRPVFGPQYEPFPVDSDSERRYNLLALIHRQPPPTALWLGTSHADTLSYPTSAALISGAKQPLSVSATVLQNAGHRTTVWLDLLPSALDWLGRSVPGFAASVPPAR